MYLKSLFACPAFVLLVLVGAANAQAALTPAANESKLVITRKDDLPRHSYQLDLDVLELYQPENREALLALANEVEADVLEDLATYDIQDASTVQGLYGVLGTIAVLVGQTARTGDQGGKPVDHGAVRCGAGQCENCRSG